MLILAVAALLVWAWPTVDPCRQTGGWQNSPCYHDPSVGSSHQAAADKDSCCDGDQQDPQPERHEKCPPLACKCMPAASSPAIVIPATLLADELPCEMAVWAPVSRSDVFLEPDTPPPILL